MNSRSELTQAIGCTFVARAVDRGSLGEAAFHRMIHLEKRRISRSRKSFLLMLLDVGAHSTSKNDKLNSAEKILSTMSLIVRETDVAGWYKEGSVVGVMFTEITPDDQKSVPAKLMTRVTETLKNHLPLKQFRQIGISFRLLPETREQRPLPQSPPLAIYHPVSAPTASETSQ